MIIHISGFPGSGKTTLGEKLQKMFGSKVVVLTSSSILSNTKSWIPFLGPDQLFFNKSAIFPDEPVTGDVHRLIRLPGSLHGGSGLKVTTISSKELEKFDPMKSAVAFGEKPVKIRSVVEHPVSMGNIAKLMPNSVVEVPEMAAIYFMARKWANLVLEAWYVALMKPVKGL